MTQKETQDTQIAIIAAIHLPVMGMLPDVVLCKLETRNAVRQNLLSHIIFQESNWVLERAAVKSV